jgi:hypothetical protein
MPTTFWFGSVKKTGESNELGKHGGLIVFVFE